MKRLGHVMRLKSNVPFSQRLNDFIMERAKEINYQARSEAPNDYETLKAMCSVNNIIVWSGASDKTIFSDDKVNIAFRAWHDLIHLKHDFDFSLEGEIATTYEQINELPEYWELERNLLESEVIGQARYYYATGDFPKDQRKFTLLYLNDRNFFLKEGFSKV